MSTGFVDRVSPHQLCVVLHPPLPLVFIIIAKDEHTKMEGQTADAQTTLDTSTTATHNTNDENAQMSKMTENATVQQSQVGGR